MNLQRMQVKREDFCELWNLHKPEACYMQIRSFSENARYGELAAWISQQQCFKIVNFQSSCRSNGGSFSGGDPTPPLSRRSRQVTYFGLPRGRSSGHPWHWRRWFRLTKRSLISLEVFTVYPSLLDGLFEHPSYKWMMTGIPMTQETSISTLRAHC